MLTVIAKLRLIAGSDRLRRSDCEIGTPFGVMKLTIAISRMAAESTVINVTLCSFSNADCSHGDQTTYLSCILNSQKVALPYCKAEMAHTPRFLLVI